MEHLNSIRRNLTPSQIFFLLIMIPLISFMPILYECCESFNKFRRLERPDYENSNWSDFYITLLFTPIIALIKYLIKKLSYEYFKSKLKKKFAGEELEHRVLKTIRNTFKVIYFVFITAFGLFIYADTNYQSPFIFGNGDHRYFYSDWPYNRVPRCLKVYYMINLSYHIEDLLFLIIHPAQNDFFEMLLHHYITLMLIGGSYMTNEWSSGINVMIQMDNGDIFVGIIKAYAEFIPSLIIFISGICMLLSWIYFRVFLFTKEIIWEGSMIGGWRIDRSHSHQTCIQVLLFSLLVLNVYWTYLIFRMFYKFIFKGETNDLQNPVEVKDGKKSKNDFS